MSVAIKKILYAADPKQSALEEAQLYMQHFMNHGGDDSDSKAWYSLELRKGTCSQEEIFNGHRMVALACGGR